MASVINKFSEGSAPSVTWGTITPLEFTTDGIATTTFTVNVTLDCGPAVDSVVFYMRDAAGTVTTNTMTGAGPYTVDIVVAVGTYIAWAVVNHTGSNIVSTSPQVQLIATAP